jgi:hypothetical protein
LCRLSAHVNKRPCVHPSLSHPAAISLMSFVSAAAPSCCLPKSSLTNLTTIGELLIASSATTQSLRSSSTVRLRGLTGDFSYWLFGAFSERDDRLSARYRSGMGANYPVVVYGFCRWPVHRHMGDEAPTKTAACRAKSA